MYLIYIYNNQNTSVEPLAFSETKEEALNKMEISARNFIIEYEGLKKWEYIFIDNKTDISKLKDGYYFMKKDNTIQVYNKISEIKTVTGWIANSQETSHQLIYKGRYDMVEFSGDLLSTTKLCTQSPAINKITNQKPIVSDKILPSQEGRRSLDDLISEIRKVGFKPTKYTKKSNTAQIKDDYIQ